MNDRLSPDGMDLTDLVVGMIMAIVASRLLS